MLDYAARQALRRIWYVSSLELRFRNLVHRSAIAVTSMACSDIFGNSDMSFYVGNMIKYCGSVSASHLLVIYREGETYDQRMES